MEPKDIKELLEMVDAAQIAELEIEHGDFKIRIRKFAREASLPVVETPFVPRPSEPQLTPAPQAQSQVQAPLPANVVEVVAPMVGTFYRAPAPDAEPYVKLGDTVDPGRVLVIIEAMKMRNEIESEYRGKVVEFLVENGEPVEYGQPLMRVHLAE